MHTLQTKPGPLTCRCLPDCPSHVRDKRQQRATEGCRERREKGHVYSAVHQSTSIPLLFPTLWMRSSLRQKRDILWILVLLAHCTHIVSVAEDEVLFFLKRGLRVLGGACRKARQNFRGIVGNFFFFPYNSPIFVGPLWQGSFSMHEIMQKFWPWRSVMNGQLRTNLSKKPVVYPGYINTLPSGAWLEVWLKIANNSTVERARSNWPLTAAHGSRDQTGGRKPALVSSSPSCPVQPIHTSLEGTVHGIKKLKGFPRHQACNSDEVELFKITLLLGKEAR